MCKHVASQFHQKCLLTFKYRFPHTSIKKHTIGNLFPTELGTQRLASYKYKYMIQATLFIDKYEGLYNTVLFHRINLFGKAECFLENILFSQVDVPNRQVLSIRVVKNFHLQRLVILK